VILQENWHIALDMIELKTSFTLILKVDCLTLYVLNQVFDIQTKVNLLKTLFFRHVEIKDRIVNSQLYKFYNGV